MSAVFAGRLVRLGLEGELLADAAERAGLDAPVPGLDWTVRDAVTHIGGVHRYAAAIVRCEPAEEIVRLNAAVDVPRGDDDGLIDWARSGHRQLVDALSVAAPDLDVITFLDAPTPRDFWCRRQAFETAIHRADVEAAAGAVTPWPPAVARDGIEELLHGFARDRSNAIAAPGALAVRPDDGGPGWQLTFGGERVEVEDDVNAGWANAMLTGTPTDIYLWLWNRPSAVVVRGDESVAALWRGVRVTWA